MMALASRRGPYVAAVAIANHNARVSWALLARGEASRRAAAAGSGRLRMTMIGGSAKKPA
jgi:hypothetical protein